MKKINLVIELDYDEDKFEGKELTQATLDEGLSLYTHPDQKWPEWLGKCRVLSFGEVVNLIQEQKDRLKDEGYAEGYADAKKESLTPVENLPEEEGE